MSLLDGNNTTGSQLLIFSNFTLTSCGEGIFIEVYAPNLRYDQNLNAMMLVIINIPSCFIAAIGNGLLLVTILKSRVIKGPTYILIGVLSTLDLMVGIVAQPIFTAIAGYPIFEPKYVCDIYFWEFSILAPVFAKNSLTILALIAFDRFCAVIIPLKYKIIITNFRVAVAVGVAMFFNVISDALVTIKFDISVYRTIMSLTLDFDYCIMVVCFVAIVIHLRARNGEFVNRASVEITKTLALASLACGLSWLPFIFSFPLMAKIYDSRDANFFVKMMFINLWSVTLTLTNSAINVFIYCSRNTILRNEMKLQLRKSFVLFWFHTETEESIMLLRSKTKRSIS